LLKRGRPFIVVSSTKQIIESVTREALPLPVTALVLCGGRSRRMGRPKAFLPYEGKTMIEHVLGIVSDLFNEILLVANEPDLFEDFDVDVVKDILPYRGPLGGILSGLLVSSNPHAFVIACDMPLVPRRLVRDIASRRHGNDVVVLSHLHGVEPLLGIYSKNCIRQLEESLFAGNLSVQDFLSGLKAQTYFYDRPEDDGLPPFFNINTPQDYSRVITGVQPEIRKFAARVL
jgi:molybdopterin-guanine dinucleotide biosynthesis protein A